MYTERMSFILSKDMKRDSGLHSFEIILFKSYHFVRVVIQPSSIFPVTPWGKGSYMKTIG